MTDKIINKINELLKLADEVYREDGNDDNFYNKFSKQSTNRQAHNVIIIAVYPLNE